VLAFPQSVPSFGPTPMDPYRDELMALRAENERLRRVVHDSHGRRGQLVKALFFELGVVLFTMIGIYALLPLLNAQHDGRFYLGVLLSIVLLATDVIAIFAIATRFSRS